MQTFVDLYFVLMQALSQQVHSQMEAMGFVLYCVYMYI